MYTIYITGYGAEITQGTLPIDTVTEINEALEEHDIELSSYIIDSTFSDDHFDWYEIDDNFHYTGAYLEESVIHVEDESGNVIYSEECSELNISNHEYTEGLYPEDSQVGAVGVITCLEVQKGTFTNGKLNSNEFDPKLLSISVRQLNDYSLISSIYYNGVEIDDLDLGDTCSKDFIAYIEE